MPINFSELVDRIEQRNLQNRQNMVAQIKPFLDVITRKATYDMEKKRAQEETAAGLVAASKAIGMTDYKPDTTLSPEMQQFTFNLQADRQAPLKQWEAFSQVYGIEPPANLKEMSPEMATVSLGKAKEDYATNEAINSTLSLYPDIAKKLMADEKYNNAKPQVKLAMLNKELADDEARNKLASEIAAYKAKSDIDIQEYWQTTGALAREKMKQDDEGTTTSTQQQTQQTNDNLVMRMEGTGVNFGSHNVAIKKTPTGTPVAETITAGKDRIQKTKLGFYYLKGGKWKPVKMKEKNGKVYFYGKHFISADDIKDLSAGYTAYEKATLNTANAQPAAAATTTNPEFDDLF